MFRKRLYQGREFICCKDFCGGVKGGVSFSVSSRVHIVMYTVRMSVSFSHLGVPLQ